MMMMASKTNQKKKISKKTRKQQQKKKSRNGDFSISLQDEIVYEIISRLPVKTLMRFKCVCKRWLSLIIDDTYFIDLHLSRSKLRPCFILAIPRETTLEPCRLPGSPLACFDYGEVTPHKAEMLIADFSETAAAGATPIVHNV
ncbi:hypothetical protein MKW92_010741, partial [Papaver armeniacum]